MIISYVVSLFDVILDIPVFLARDSWNRFARPGLNAQLRRRAAVLRPRRDPVHVQHTYSMVQEHRIRQ